MGTVLWERLAVALERRHARLYAGRRWSSPLLVLERGPIIARWVAWSKR